MDNAIITPKRNLNSTIGQNLITLQYTGNDPQSFTQKTNRTQQPLHKAKTNEMG